MKKKAWIVFGVVQLFLILTGAGLLAYHENHLTERAYVGREVPIYAEKQGENPEYALSLKRGSYEIDITYRTENETTCASFLETAYGMIMRMRFFC